MKAFAVTDTNADIQILMQIIQRSTGLTQVKPNATDGFLVNCLLSCKSLMKMLPGIVV